MVFRSRFLLRFRSRFLEAILGFRVSILNFEKGFRGSFLNFDSVLFVFHYFDAFFDQIVEFVWSVYWITLFYWITLCKNMRSKRQLPKFPACDPELGIKQSPKEARSPRETGWCRTPGSYWPAPLYGLAWSTTTSRVRNTMFHRATANCHRLRNQFGPGKGNHWQREWALADKSHGHWLRPAKSCTLRHATAQMSKPCEDFTRNRTTNQVGCERQIVYPAMSTVEIR